MIQNGITSKRELTTTCLQRPLICDLYSQDIYSYLCSTTTYQQRPQIQGSESRAVVINMFECIKELFETSK
jgi:hypothetical protein